MVRPPAESAGLPPSASFMPSLKPRTAPPRSAPMLRSFLVPNTKSTMTRTMTQCQILRLPMSTSHQRPLQGLGAAQNVNMQMIHLLPPYPPSVHDSAETVVAAQLAGDARDRGQKLAQDGLM